MACNIIQWNCRGLRPNFIDFRLLCDDYLPIVCCLQETMLNNDNYSIRGYTAFNLIRRDIGGRSCGGVSVLVRDGIPHGECPLNTTLQAKAVIISTPKTITICSLYLPPSENLNMLLLSQLVDQLPKPFIICGDFNGHSITWGCDSNNSRGNKIDDFITNNDLCLLNDGSFTYLHPGSGSYTAIDLSLCSPDLLLDLNFKVEADSFGSDHFPIILEIGISLPDTLPRWNFKRADWVHFNELCKNTLTLNTVDLLQEPVTIFTDTLCNIAKTVIPMSTTKQKKRCKPWFNTECDVAIKARRKALKEFKRNISSENLRVFKIAKAKARRICRASKRGSWHSFVSKLNRKTTIKTTWDMVRRISGKYKSNTVSQLKLNDVNITDVKDIANTLAEKFAFNSSSDNYTRNFNKHKLVAEKKNICFNSRDDHAYNSLFSLYELKKAINNSHDSSPGLDTIHYQLLKHLPDISLLLLLHIFNHIWVTQEFPSSWKTSIVIPIPKPGKNLSEPGSYRPIALTSCLCKTMERIVNSRLTWYLERNKVFTKFQSGFRKRRSTVDNLVTLESSIRDAFVSRKHLVSIFFDLEKAYDTAWKHGILSDLFEAGLRGRLPEYIRVFLSDRLFKVRVGNTYSDTYIQEIGVPQGSILSVTLFSLKINSIVSCLMPDVLCSLYVDDLAIYYSSSHMPSIERKLQQSLNRLSIWCDMNGFKFSPTKTMCVHFCQSRKLHDDPNLFLNGTQLPIIGEAKFLGLIFDSKLSFIPHINSLKTRCSKALDLIKVLSNTSWGADRKVLLRLYRALIRSKLDYGCIIYGAARPSYIKKLDPIHNQGLRLCLGAFRTSPMTSLYVEANEPPLHIRRTKLALQYSVKIMSDEANPANPVVFQPSLVATYESKPNAIRPLGLRITNQLDEVGFHPHMIAPFKTSKIPPWTMAVPNVCFDLCKYKKCDTDPALFRLYFLELSDSFIGYTHIFTDGSKDGDKTSAAFVCPSFEFSKRLPNKASIFTAELEALASALRYIKHAITNTKFVIFCDSKSVLQAITSKWDHPTVQIIMKFLVFIHSIHKTVIFCWIPSHVGIIGNEKADAAAKAALVKDITDCLISYTDSRQYIGQFVRDLWQTEWDLAVNNKLHAIKPLIGEQPSAYRSVRRDEVVLCRLKVGHTYLTHSHLLRGEPPPQCDTCQCRLTVSHILLDCREYDFFRPLLFANNASLHDIFKNVSVEKIITFVKNAHIYSEI